MLYILPSEVPISSKRTNLLEISCNSKKTPGLTWRMVTLVTIYHHIEWDPRLSVPLRIKNVSTEL